MSGYAIERLEFSKRLSSGGLEDVLVLPRETATKLQSPALLELLEQIADGSEQTQDELAEAVGRDTHGVCDDLNTLFEADVIEFGGEGSEKYPVLTHDTICAEPIVMHGTVLPERGRDGSRQP